MRKTKQKSLPFCRAALLALGALLGASSLMGCSCPTKVVIAGAHGEAITVVGTGKLLVKPDMAQIQIGVQSRAQTVDAASKDNNAQMQRLLAALKAAGVAEADLQTSNYSVHYLEHHDHYPQPPMPVVQGKSAQEDAAKAALAGEFQVSNTLNVKVRDVSKVGALLDRAVAAGANHIWGVHFGLANEDALHEKLRALAVADGKARAGKLAQLGGVTLGKVLAISEVHYSGGLRGAGDAQMLKAATESSAGAAIEGGELELSAQIELSYAIAE